MSTKIGCANLVYALQTTEDEAAVAPVYAEPVAAPGVMSVMINANSSAETLFADDGPLETATTLGRVEVEIKKNELTTENKADLLGHKIDADGALVYGGADVAPAVAVGFKTLKSNGKYRYIWLYKGRFTEPEDNNETKGDTINFQPDTIRGQFVKLQYSYVADGVAKYPWKYELDEESPAANPVAIAVWFDAVRFPTDVASV